MLMGKVVARPLPMEVPSQGSWPPHTLRLHRRIDKTGRQKSAATPDYRPNIRRVSLRAPGGLYLASIFILNQLLRQQQTT